MISDFCSHRRSVDFWAESVADDRSFDAIALRNSPSLLSLPSWSKFKTNNFFDEGNTVRMGIACPATARGKYYLQTNREAPFGRSSSGIRFDSSV